MALQKREGACAPSEKYWLPNRDNLRTEHGLVLTLPRAWSRVEMARANARRSRRPRAPRVAVRMVPNPIVRARAYEAARQGGARSYPE